MMVAITAIIKSMVLAGGRCLAGLLACGGRECVENMRRGGGDDADDGGHVGCVVCVVCVGPAPRQKIYHFPTFGGYSWR